jgi:hypothetical protein
LLCFVFFFWLLSSLLSSLLFHQSDLDVVILPELIDSTRFKSWASSTAIGEGRVGSIDDDGGGGGGGGSPHDSHDDEENESVRSRRARLGGEDRCVAGKLQLPQLFGLKSSHEQMLRVSISIEIQA